MVPDDGAAAGGGSATALRSLSCVTTSAGGVCSVGGRGSGAVGGGGGSGSVTGAIAGVVELLWDGEDCCLIMSTATASRTIAPIGNHATLRHELRLTGGNGMGARVAAARAAGTGWPDDDGGSRCLLTPVFLAGAADAVAPGATSGAKLATRPPERSCQPDCGGLAGRRHGGWLLERHATLSAEILEVLPALRDDRMVRWKRLRRDRRRPSIERLGIGEPSGPLRDDGKAVQRVGQVRMERAHLGFLDASGLFQQLICGREITIDGGAFRQLEHAPSIRQFRHRIVRAPSRSP